MRLSDNLIQKVNRVLCTVRDVRILVIGDVILDRYIYGAVNRISPEAPVPVFLIEREEYKLGGAANVARNLQALGSQVKLVGIAGADHKQSKLMKILSENKIQYHLQTVNDFCTIEKTRLISQNQQLLRIDREKSCSMKEKPDSFYDVLEKDISHYDCVLISDYAKGVFDKRISQIIKEQNGEVKILVDPKVKNKSLYGDIYMMTPNLREAEELSLISNLQGNRKRLIHAGELIKKQYGLVCLLITMGPDGMLLFQKQGTIVHIPALAKKIYDVTGAGDTVISVLGFGLANGLSELESAFLANLAASEVVAEVGTSFVTKKRCLDLLHKLADEVDLEVWRDGKMTL